MEINVSLELLFLQNLANSIGYTLDNVQSFDTLRIRNIMVLLQNEIKTYIDTKRNGNREHNNK